MKKDGDESYNYMNECFWQKLKKPFTVLAPMANVTDWAFRQVIVEAGRPSFAPPPLKLRRASKALEG